MADNKSKMKIIMHELWKNLLSWVIITILTGILWLIFDFRDTINLVVLQQENNLKTIEVNVSRLDQRSVFIQNMIERNATQESEINHLNRRVGYLEAKH